LISNRLAAVAVCGYSLYNIIQFNTLYNEIQKYNRFLKYIDKSSLCRSRFLKFAFIAKWYLSEYKSANYCVKVNKFFNKKTKI